MNTIKKKLSLFIILISLYANAQNPLMKLGFQSANIELTENETVYQEEPIINNQTFTYKYKGGDVVVTFNGDEHVEMYNNKRNHIKSSIVWISKNECIITLDEITLPDFPFSPGNSLKMKITEVKGKTIYYESTLAGRTWEGKMTQIENLQEDMIASN
ncbi:hypothetical protein FDT66_00825 [Polaribacter aestuariivivens]|uniref:DUF2846 domain-containing protein n=1 Tax=Polaribacter aestuariivivens TaxID=2304626 RepID=A0A5S3N9S8_9FLAO|nr:hypothetical protein [Polaribacter aestuariivivens]TMM32041.1 hypothetical protein FDT66_00825 [Polaribacter aestuariivivens]